MKIAVNVTVLAHSIAGIGRYTYEIIRRLSKEKDCDLYLYSAAPLPDAIVKEFAPKVYRTSISTHPAYRYLWSETVLPFHIRKDSPDLFWSPLHHLPKFLPSSTPSVLTVHDLVCELCPETLRAMKGVFERRRLSSAIHKANTVIAVSDSCRRDVISHFPQAKNKTSAIHLGASIKKKTNGIALALPENFLLFVGTLEPRKNLSRLLHSYSLLDLSLKKHFPLIVVGQQGWGHITIEDSINEFSLKEHVVVWGHANDQELLTLYQSAHCLILPSIYEGFGLPITEALNAGTPVLTSNRSSMPEVAGKAAHYINPMSIESIKQGLENIILDQKLYETLQQETKRQATHFDWDVCTQKHWKVFSNLINHSSPSKKEC